MLYFFCESPGTFPGAWAPGRAAKIELQLHSEHISENLVTFPDLELAQSFRNNFSGTYRFQNLKLHAFILNLTASRGNR